MAFKKMGSEGLWYVGITKEDIRKTKSIMLGKKRGDWSYGGLGFKRNNDIESHSTATIFHWEGI